MLGNASSSCNAARRNGLGETRMGSAIYFVHAPGLEEAGENGTGHACGRTREKEDDTNGKVRQARLSIPAERAPG